MRKCFELALVWLILSVLCCSAGASTVSEAKLQPDGASVSIGSVAATYAEPGFFYVQNEPRGMGIRVELPGHGLQPGARVIVSGTITTNTDKERYVFDPQLTPDGSGSVPALGMRCGALGGGDWLYGTNGEGSGQRGITDGIGLNTVGLLVRVWGRYCKSSATEFSVDDGSGAGISCTVANGTQLVSYWEYVSVTGVCSISRDPQTGVIRPIVLVSSIVADKTETISKPGTPYGEAAPTVRVPCLYSTTGATSNYDHEIEYQVSFGDGTQSAWSVLMGDRHAYATTGPKTITVTARCKLHPEVCATSDPFTVNVVDGIGWVHCATPATTAASYMVADKRGNLYAGNDYGFYRSSDHGSTWICLLASQRVNEIAVDSRGWLYISSSSSKYGILRSKDYGDHWTCLGIGNGFMSTSAVDIQTDSVGTVYARGYVGSNQVLYRSVDGGDSFTLGTQTGMNFDTSGFTEDSSGNVYFGHSSSVYRSSDRGLTWTKISGVDAPSYVKTMASTDGYIFAAAYQGVYRSSDQGAHWTLVGPAGENGQYVSGDGQGRLFVSCRNNYRTYRSDDDGTTWQLLSVPSWEAPAVGSGGHVYVCAHDPLRNYRSPDHGDTWELFGGGLDNFNARAVCSDSSGRLLVAGYGVYRTADRGDNWTQMYSSSSAIVSVDPTGAIFAADDLPYSSPLVRSTDGGANWSTVWQLTNCYVDSLAVTSNNTLIAHVIKMVEFAEWSRWLMRSIDGGTTWTPVTSEAGVAQTKGSFAIVPSGAIYHFAREQLSRSTNNGASWTVLNPLPTAMSYEAASDSSGALYYIANYIYKSTDGGSTWNSISSNAAKHLAISGDRILTSYYKIHLSTDRGATWQEITSGLPGRQAIGGPEADTTMLGFDADGYGYVGTPVGLYRTNRSLTH